MAGGCIKNFFATLGCLAFLVIVGLGAWVFRDQLGDAYRKVSGREPPFGASADSTVGVPSVEALRSAERKESTMAEGRDGFVRLTADEVAALVERRLDPGVREAVDSLRVVLYEDRLALEGRVRLDVFGRDLLGPLAGMLDSSEGLRMAGALEVLEPRRLAWDCDEFVLVGFPFPASVIPALVNRMTGRNDGAFPIPVPETVGDVRVRPDGVTLYRRVD
jgi:hypothetical protein